ncbi:hypothetical protein [Streptomyces pratensis]|uniref:hypothetical protein n=1 Tax=Streptomyces pratensis TaxID=1169025 RepID=UPI003018A7C5
MLTRSRGFLLPLSAAVVAAVMAVPTAGAADAPAPDPAGTTAAEVPAGRTEPAPRTEPAAQAEPAPQAVPLPEADVSHHGHVALRDDRLAVRFRTANRGPADIAASTVRLRFSEPPAARQRLPEGCLWGGASVVLCATGELRSGGRARWTALDLRLAGRPAEVVVRVDTVWNGGVRDTDPRNDAHTVLAPSTGDAYAF